MFGLGTGKGHTRRRPTPRAAVSQSVGIFRLFRRFRPAMPSGTGSGRRNLILPAALAAALPVGVAAALYLAVPAAAPDGARARLTPAEPEEEVASPACREQSQRVTIDGAPVDAFAVLCRDDKEGSWVLAGPPPGDAAVEATFVAEESAPSGTAASAASVASTPEKPAVRRGADHGRRPAVAPRHSTHRAYRPRYADWGTAPPQAKYGP